MVGECAGCAKSEPAMTRATHTIRSAFRSAFCSAFPYPQRLLEIRPTFYPLGFSHQRPLNSTRPLGSTKGQAVSPTNSAIGFSRGSHVSRGPAMPTKSDKSDHILIRVTCSLSGYFGPEHVPPPFSVPGQTRPQIYFWVCSG